MVEQLHFRDDLIENEQLKIAYEKLKQNLAKANKEDKHQYAQAKTAFIHSVLTRNET